MPPTLGVGTLWGGVKFHLIYVLPSKNYGGSPNLLKARELFLAFFFIAFMLV